MRLKFFTETYEYLFSFKKRYNWFTGVVVNDNQFVIHGLWTEQFELPSYSLTPFCLTCKTEKNLTRHHVVPKRIIKQFPLKIKQLFNNNLVTLCRPCHDKCEKSYYVTNKYNPSCWIKKFNHFLNHFH
jgi:5-methylcytosine-specific restriction endonuclease McrA